MWPGQVPELECREAANFALYNWREWLELEHEDRVMAVAHYRMHIAIEAHVNDASERAAERRARSRESVVE